MNKIIIVLLLVVAIAVGVPAVLGEKGNGLFEKDYVTIYLKNIASTSATDIGEVLIGGYSVPKETVSIVEKLVDGQSKATMAKLLQELNGMKVNNANVIPENLQLITVNLSEKTGTKQVNLYVDPSNLTIYLPEINENLDTKQIGYSPKITNYIEPTDEMKKMLEGILANK